MGYEILLQRRRRRRDDTHARTRSHVLVEFNIAACVAAVLASLRRLPRRMPKVELDDELPLLLGRKVSREECRILLSEPISIFSSGSYAARISLVQSLRVTLDGHLHSRYDSLLFHNYLWSLISYSTCAREISLEINVLFFRFDYDDFSKFFLKRICRKFDNSL